MIKVYDTSVSPKREILLLNPRTHAIASYSTWYEIFLQFPSEAWGGEKFEDGGLIEVYYDEETKTYKKLY